MKIFRIVNNLVARLYIYANEFGLRKTLRCMIYKILLGTIGRTLKRSFVDIDGLKIYLIPNDSGISTELKLFKVHEPLGTSTLRKLLKIGMNIIDIGSNIGYYALIEAKLCGDKGRVIAIEPNPITFQYLARNIRVNHLTNVMARNIAVWDKKGVIDFVVLPQSNLCYVKGLRNDLTDIKGITENNVINVPATTFDDLFQELYEQHQMRDINLIRIDVEGAEWQILNGAWHTIEHFLPRIFIELHISMLGEVKSRLLLNKLKTLGYETKYVISRHIDLPIHYTYNDVKHVGIDSLISGLPSLTRTSFQHALLLFLESSQSARKSYEL